MAQDFATRAAMATLFEITSSRDALKRAKTPAVRRLAQALIVDHTKMGRALAAATEAAGVKFKMPFGEGALDNFHRGLLRQLLNGAHGYETTFAEMQIHAHQDAITLFTSYAQRGDNEKLRAFAQRTLPQLRRHMQMAEQAHQAAALDSP